MNRVIESGQVITLLSVTSTKISVSWKGSQYFLGYGYQTSKKPFSIIVDSFVGQAVISADGALYRLEPEKDDDFYVLVDL